MKDLCVYNYVTYFFAQLDKDIIKVEWAGENSEDKNEWMVITWQESDGVTRFCAFRFLNFYVCF